MPTEKRRPEFYLRMKERSAPHLLVVCSFTEKELVWRLPEETAGQTAQRLIGNYEDSVWGPELTLRPYEAVVWEWTDKQGE